jgi:lipid-A-disaccharide synthase
MLSAGEASGDLHASELMHALSQADGEAQFAFLGGDLMSAAAGGATPLVHYRDMAYMGFADVVRHLPQVRRNFSVAAEQLRSHATRPDVLILVDYPSFNLRLARVAQSVGVPVYYYISPKVWAWKSHRVKPISQLCRRVLSILPFEEEFYRQRGYDHCVYVGNPSVEEIDRKLASAPSREAFVAANRLDPSRQILALVPGSRRSEIRSNLPIMLEAARRAASQRMDMNLQIVVAGAPAIAPELYEAIDADVTVIFGQTTELMHHATAALVTSGTAALEAALARVPQVVCYRHNGSRLTYAVMSHVLKIPYVTLPNLIANAPVVPELLLHHCTAQAVYDHLMQLLPGGLNHRAQQQGYVEVRERLGAGGAAKRAADILTHDFG